MTDSTNVTRSNRSTSAAAAPSWGKILAPEELEHRGLTMAKLAEEVGVTAAFLRLVRQGRRSPSREKVLRILLALGYEVEAPTGEEQVAVPDLLVKDDHGQVMQFEVKSRSPRPPIDKRLDEVVGRLESLVDPASGSGGALPELFAWLSSGAGAGLTYHVAGIATGPSPTDTISTLRREVSSLLDRVADDDLPLVASYLRILIARPAPTKTTCDDAGPAKQQWQ